MAGLTGLMSQSSGEFEVVDLERADDVAERQVAVARLLRDRQLDGVLIARPENFAWLTAGADNARGTSAPARIFLTAESRVLVTNNVESQYLFDKELPGLGFQLKERPWFEPEEALPADLCRGRSVGSDDGFARTVDVSGPLASLRLPLSPRDQQHLRSLGREVAHAVEATARGCRPGETEAEIAAELAHRLVKRQIIPVRMQVCADGRFRRYPHYPFGGEAVRASCVIAAVGRRAGLHAACARSVLFADDDAFREAHHKAVLMQSTGMFFCRAGANLQTVWPKVRRIYEKFGCPDEWQLADQAEVTGYAPTEVRVTPTADFPLTAAMPVHWHPAVGPALTGDTILLRDGVPELVTPADDWPLVTITVKGEPIRRPDVLRR